MRKRVIAKGNLHESDYYRVLVTETLPGDVPIVVSNDGFYRNMRRMEQSSPAYAETVRRILEPLKQYTIPYRYNISRPSATPRRLALMHPAAQCAVVDFYRAYAYLICYYARKSEASIRSPSKIASTFFVRSRYSEANKLKSAGIDTTDIEHAVANPASFFAYRGYNRVYKFFNSPEYLRLERRYSVMLSADISKCFHSLYTHTMFWATADVETAKDNVKAMGFGNAFDKLMQSANYNETNGIVVGPEVSRIFAELILSEVDRRAISTLEMTGFKYRSNFEFFRYVDDYFIFADDDEVASSVLSVLSNRLSEFNLHFNDQKTVPLRRPFVTAKSRVIRDTNVAMQSFFDKILESVPVGVFQVSSPKRIFRSFAVVRSLIDGVKSHCYDHSAGYSEVSNYIIGAVAERVSALIDGYSVIPQDQVPSDEQYVKSILVLLEVAYFFYIVDPTVPSSLRVAQCAIQAFGFFEKTFPERAPFLSEQIVRWTFQFIKGLRGTRIYRDADCVPLEAINLLLVLGEVGRTEVVAQDAIKEFCDDVDKMGYFEIVSYLFCIKGNPEYDELRGRLVDRAIELVEGAQRVRLESQAAHLALDILSCPFVPPNARAAILNKVRTDSGLPPLPIADALGTVSEFEANFWFVNWQDTNLLRMIRKKELSSVY